MSLQNDIIKTALLGTDKIQFQLPEELSDIRDGITATQEDKEDAFLKSAAIAFLYEESGQEAKNALNAIPECPDDTSEELSASTSQHLEDALLSKDEVFFEYLLTKTLEADKTVSSKLVPLLLNKAIEQKRKAEKLIAVCGKTGEWLCSLNPNWQRLTLRNEEQIDWETGSLEDRKLFLARLRTTDPDKALQLLQAVFEQENANNRAEFLEILEIGISVQDEAFLLEALKDKSKKVKEVALRLLQPLQGTEINNLYINYFLDSVSIKEERSLLILKKKVIEIDPAVLPSDDMFRYGIEKVSSVKGVDDQIFWLSQILSFIDPSALEERYQITQGEWFKLLIEHKQSSVFIPYLATAAIRFRNTPLAKNLLAHVEAFREELLLVLSEDERYEWYDKYLESRFPIILGLLLNDQYSIIPQQLAERIVKRLAVNPYVITQPIYTRLALSLPVSIRIFLSKYIEEGADDYQRRYFSSQASNMLHYIELREGLTF
ncbi:DUF5691 domain-containing protein [Desertivirga brevis]|uniref:DUF5691 domain-containing protein n=1 Tax=Desertivirga brevis TaxID=2810310 RepID=UPI001A962202|nr:DUF5691 domain-containing protein [Pedobacter sp. SYSU D00873]